MSFSLYLKNKISKKQIKRSNLIAQLNLFHNEFEYLDSITFSRWITNKTIPSTYKQILISHFFGEDLISFMLNHVTIRRKSKLAEHVFDKIVNKIESSYANISYYYSDEEPSYIVDILDYDKYTKEFGDYYNNFQLYKDLLSLFKDKNIRKDHLCIIKRRKTLISSHISATKLDDALSDIYSDFFKVKIDGDYFVNLSHLENRETYFLMRTLLFYFFYKKSVRYFTSLVRKDFLEFFTLLPYKQVGSTYVDKSRNLYLVRVDFLEVISHPFVMNFFLQVLTKSNNLDDLFSKELSNQLQL
ncbi:hypothetical protein [Photobacterium damselae]|uniref:hypothetical protein n=1 Tax=Photobacterium damselae TaxID=38293 RepID=UPI004068F92F